MTKLEMEIRLKEASLFYLRLEEASRLLVLCREAGIAVEDLMELPVKRQREKAAVRLLLCRAFGRPVTLSYTEQGAPFVAGSDVNVSISHTPRLVVLACSAEDVIGVDAEQKDRRQVLRVRDKFLNVNEKRFIAADDLLAHIIAWTAKEAIIKAERNSSLDWTNGITLEPFAVNDPWPDEISLVANCHGRRYSLMAQTVEDHVVTVACAPVD